VFTGIVNQTCPVVELASAPGLTSFAVELPPVLTEGLEIGASVAIDGCCQTVTRLETSPADMQNSLVWFDAMQETLLRTTLGSLLTGQRVNVERAAKFGQEIGGHELSGHIDVTARVLQVTTSETNHIITFALPDEIKPYVFNKGYLGIHGASLTVSDLDKVSDSFKVYLIPETLRQTNLGEYCEGAMLNIEVDRRTQIIVETVRSYLQENNPDLSP